MAGTKNSSVLLPSTSVFLSLIFFIGASTASAASYSMPSSAENSTLSALLHFKASISYDPYDVMSSWNTSSHFCNWHGIVCANSSHQVESLLLSDAALHGTLSPHIGNLQGLSYLDLSGNTFSGPVPRQLSDLAPSLVHLDLSVNHFTGALPDALMNCSHLILFHISNNRLSGHLPSDWSKLASSLQQLDLRFNSFNGPFRASLFNLTHLWTLLLSGNQLTGKFPPSDLGQMKSLQYLHLSNNQLSGPLPSSLGQMKSLSSLYLSHNQLSGSLPLSLGQMKSLYFLDFSQNQLSGPLLSSLGQMKSLYFLYLSHNQLSGPLPLSLGQMTSLEYLYLSQNQLSGPLPSSLGQMTSLRDLYLSQNQLSGPLPSSFWQQMKSLDSLDLSHNQLSGPLPPSLQQMESLSSLDLSYNQLSGPLPPSLQQMESLSSLDLSYNQLSGPLPPALEILTHHSSRFNVSYNRMQGMIPDGYQSLSYSSFLGNPGLCGPPLITNCTSHSKRNMKLYVLVLVCVVGAVSLMASLMYAWWHFFYKRNRPGSDFVVPQYKAWTAEEMRAATNNFDAANVIGSGAVSMCYLGMMKVPEGMREVAMKRLIVDDYDGEDEEGRKSFVNEFKTLCKMRHRNLVKVLGYCVEGGEIALMMEYMEKGDLGRHLHNEANKLSWEERVNVALDVAEGLVYLHHEYEQPIIHCDLKPKNILLSSDMVAKICDFGIAKLLEANETGDMSMSKVRGTIGYIAPEYGMGSRISTKVDVYSYGMLLLELVTRVSPTSPMFEDEFMSLRTWVETLHASGRIREALRNYDLAILQEAEEILRLGVQCTHDVAKKRPTMYMVRDSIVQLKRQRNQSPLRQPRLL